MGTRKRLIFSVLAVGIILYLLDAIVYYKAQATGENFFDILILKVPVHEFYDRMILIAGILLPLMILYLYINTLIKEIKSLKQQDKNTLGERIDSDFISGLSYQIRTPLNAIVGFSELLKDPNLSAQSKQTYINQINSSGSYLLQLLNNLYDISRIESKQITLNKSDTRIYDLFEDIKKQFEERKKEAGKESIDLILHHGVEDQNFKILIDRSRFGQVLTNLLENALKYTDEGFIEFGYLIKDKGQMEVVIKDSGQGYSRERLEMILKRYRKLTDNQNQPFDVVALRLTISKNLLKLMGGDLYAEYDPGKGSGFVINLPFSESISHLKEKDEDYGDEDLLEKRDWGKRTILIAEDVESNFIYLQELLKPTGANLIWVKNGEEAVREVERNPGINVVLMDILMPEMDGYEASQKIKRIRPELPLIAQTAYNLEGNRSAGAHIYFDDYLIKPLWAPQLLAAIEKHFNRSLI